MPETIEAPPAAETGGIDSFMSDVMQGIEETPASPPPAAPAAPKDPPAPPAKPAEAVKATPAPKAEPAKPAAKPPEAPAKPPEKPKEDMNQLRRRHDELLAERKKTQSEVAKLQEENRALAGKRYVTPEMEKEIEDNKAEIKRLKAEFEEAAYERSEPFKKEYVARYQRVQDSALAAVQHFPVTTKRLDENGETQTANRASTPADYWKVRNADPSERAQIARELFGDNALTLLTEIRELDRIKSDADMAVKQRGESQAENAKQAEIQQRESTRKYNELRDSSRAEIVERYPQLFAPDESNPEESEALAKGFEFADKLANGNSLSPDERAAMAEVARAKLAWFNRGNYKITKLTEKVASLESELAKYRGTDPGAGKENGSVETRADDDGTGIEGMAARIEREMAG